MPGKTHQPLSAILANAGVHQFFVRGMIAYSISQNFYLHSYLEFQFFISAISVKI